MSVKIWKNQIMKSISVKNHKILYKKFPNVVPTGSGRIKNIVLHLKYQFEFMYATRSK